jgi:transposase
MVAGAQASAIIYSLMLTCRACGVEPFMYCAMCSLNCRSAPEADVTDLLPFRFARQRLANTPQAS